MAQAITDDSTQMRIRQNLAQQRAAAAATQARAAANMPGAPPAAAGINVGAPVSPDTLTPAERAGFANQGAKFPDPAAAARADMQARAAQMANQAGANNVAGSDVPAAARRGPLGTATVGPEVSPATLTPAERAGFARQGATFAEPAPSIATPTPAATVSEAAPVVEAAKPGLIRTAGKIVGGAARVAGVAGGVYEGGVAARDIYQHGADYNNVSDLASGTAIAGSALAGANPVGLAVGAGAAGFGIGRGIGNHIDTDNPVTNTLAGIVSPYGGMGSDAAVQQKIDSDRAAMVADRQARGLPVPVQRQPNLVVNPPISTGVVSAVNSTAQNVGIPPEVAGDPVTKTGYGRVVNGVPTYSDGSGNPAAKGYVPRTMTPDDIAGLANGNRISVADPGAGGGIASAAAGGTLNLGDGPTGGRAGFTAADRQQQADNIERRGNNYQFDQLMKKSQTALANGHMNTSKILAGIAGAYSAKNPAQAPPGNEAMTAAKIAEANAATAENTSQARRRNKSSDLIDQANAERDPVKRQSLYDTLLASEGKDTGRVVMMKVPDAGGAVDQLGNPVMNEVPFDTRTGRMLYTPPSRPTAIATK